MREKMRKGIVLFFMIVLIAGVSGCITPRSEQHVVYTGGQLAPHVYYCGFEDNTVIIGHEIGFGVVCYKFPYKENMEITLEHIKITNITIDSESRMHCLVIYK